MKDLLHKQLQALSGNREAIINLLRVPNRQRPEWTNLKRLFDHKEHEVNRNQGALKDKVRADGSIDKSSRIALPLEKLATRRMTEFAFAIPVRRKYTSLQGETETTSAQIALEAVYRCNRIDAENNRRGFDYFASCEMATIWYTTEQAHKLYGTPAKFKIKCKSISPRAGYELYPYFDADGDLIAFSFLYAVQEGKESKVLYFEAYTDRHRYKFRQGKDGWETLIDQPHALGKIPVAYIYRSESIYQDIENLRNELEFTLSRQGNTIAYNSAPILKVKGEISGAEHKGESQRIFRVEEGGDVAYVSWAQSSESVKAHVDTLLEMIFTVLQLPNLSSESMKKLGNIGFDARQTILADAHLKVGDEAGALVEFLEREASVVSSLLALVLPQLRSEIEDTRIEHIITPFIQNDREKEIEVRLKANGGKPLESWRESIERLGESDNPSETLRQIQEELAELSEQARQEQEFTATF